MRTIHIAVVTGPTGVIGHALCEKLLREGVKVYACIRPSSTRAGELPKEVVKLPCAVSEYANLPGRIGHADAFFHLAWDGTERARRDDPDVQVANIHNTLEACRAAAVMGCSVFVGAGSQAEYGRTDALLKPDTPCFPETGYGIAKLCTGQMARKVCADLRVDFVWPRILSVYGPRNGLDNVLMSTILELLAGRKPALTAGEQRMDYLYSDDAAEAMYLLALHGRNGAVYPLGNGQARALREYLEILRDAIDPALLLGFGEIPSASRRAVNLEVDLSALQEDTGFAPRVSFEAGIRKTIDWCRAHSLRGRCEE